ncbi:hypothetical protein OAS39_04775 [Pirellulales bacterium]|nr:hypothetical protein [Pirellulales bacterium]
MKQAERLASPIAAFAILLCSGCEESTTGEIHGTVTVDGVPVQEGSIAFFPTDGESFTAGAAITDGAYSTRIPFGKMRVEVRVPKQVGEQSLYNTPDSPKMQILVEALPSRYNNRSELSITVEPGRSKHNLELTSK